MRLDEAAAVTHKMIHGADAFARGFAVSLDAFGGSVASHHLSVRASADRVRARSNITDGVLAIHQQQQRASS